MSINIDFGDPKVKEFYRDCFELLNESKIPFLLGGWFAVNFYTGIHKDTKDLDVFCKPGDYLKILKYFADRGYRTENTDARWLAKIYKDELFMDVIFDTVNGICTVEDYWFEKASEGTLFGIPIKIMPAEELLWCKIYVQNRERFDGSDINHLILKYGKNLDWKRILNHFDNHWQLLLSQIIMFQFVYPADRDIVPKWLYDELINRARDLYDVPPPLEKVSRGPIIDQTQYKIDITEWDYKVVTIKTI